MYGVDEQVMSSSTHPSSFLYNLSLLKDRVHQVQSLATIFISPDNGHLPESASIAIPTMGTLIQEIIVVSSSMMFSCQQMALGQTNEVELQHQRGNNVTEGIAGGKMEQPAGSGEAVERGAAAYVFFSNQHETRDQWYGDQYNNSNSNEDDKFSCPGELPQKTEPTKQHRSPNNSDIIELAAADLLAKYTHYCHVCGKGFKRDANLRMHMRAHGDEYKSTAALSNPMKKKPNSAGENGGGGGGGPKPPRKYSCPHQGCRWNKNHMKFQPLKSIICVKNHYRRSHCPKMYVCKRCSRKQFSVLSDLRTHEKHCGDLKWRCSCGTTFSRKDKLMGHVALFVGHEPAVNCAAKIGSGYDEFGTYVGG